MTRAAKTFERGEAVEFCPHALAKPRDADFRIGTYANAIGSMPGWHRVRGDAFGGFRAIHFVPTRRIRKRAK